MIQPVNERKRGLVFQGGYAPDGSYPSRVVYLDRDDVVDGAHDACIGRPGEPCPGVMFEPRTIGLEGDVVHLCPEHWDGMVLPLPDWDHEQVFEELYG